MTKQADPQAAASPPAAAPVARSSLGRIVAASLAGNTLEWYDFFLYTTAAAMVLGDVFFPAHGSPLLGTIAALATHAVGFAARPFGGILFGHIGDRRGRRTALIATLSLMGAATFCMGLLPSYDTAGLISPVLLVLLRVLQGVAAGGEWGGGVLILSENAPPHRRGLFSSFSSSGLGLGYILAALALIGAERIAGDAFATWGWRLPFLASAVIFVVGLYIRRHVAETASFTETSREEGVVRAPLVEVLRTNPRGVLTAVGLRFAENGAGYIFLSFSLVYGRHVGVSTDVLLWGVVVAMAVDSGLMVFFGHLSDRLGRRPVYLAGAVAMVLWTVPFFLLMNTASAPAVWLALIGGHITMAAMTGVQPSYFSELFSTETRYSGMAIGHELASAVAGGLSPVIAAVLLASYGSFWPVAALTIGLALVTVVTVVVARETRPT
ncbi:MFS transporter [Streptomyces asiaticus]|uniref:MFS transporter n=1 Tax=Streptomyces asiaticus TaxID=114695 RepID=UPI0037FA5D40